MLWNAPWNPSGTTDRFQQGAGQVDRLWILDVEGRRLLIDATYVPGSTDQDRAQLQQVVDSITSHQHARTNMQSLGVSFAVPSDSTGRRQPVANC